jgi:hypothetical protein
MAMKVDGEVEVWHMYYFSTKKISIIAGMFNVKKVLLLKQL